MNTQAHRDETNLSEPTFISIYPDCPKCFGKGTTLIEMYITGSGFADVPVRCSNCDGEGWITVEVCSACNRGEAGCKCADQESEAA